MKAAYLGPEGSYTELALRKYRQPDEGLACRSFAEIFHAVDEGRAAYGFVPLENVLQGPITETLDLLFEFRGRIYIEHSYTMEIEHCLGAIAGTELHSVTKVYSREQALQQCADFLAATLPQADLLTKRSTAAAAEELRNSGLAGVAVIAAEKTLESFGLVVLARDIADRKDNKTRFALIRKGPLKRSPRDYPAILDSAVEGTVHGEYTTHVVVDPGRDRQGLLYELLQVISVQFQVNLSFIHSRPDPRGIFVFHLSLEGHLGDPNIQNCIRELEEYCKTSTGDTAEILVCGSYLRHSFHAPPFSSVGIVGGDGKMGRWFSALFQQAGLTVLVCDRSSGVSLAELAEQSEVILISVPMSAATEVVSALAPMLRPGQLVVENGSIKSSILPALLEKCTDQVEVLGIHTMFANDISNLRDENIIVTRTERSAVLADAFESLLYKYGARLSHLDVKTHDELSAFFQSLFHCTMVALAETMRETLGSPNSIETFSTPNSRSILTTMRRVLNQNEDLLLDLQTLNREYPRTRRIYFQSMFRLLTALEHGDLETFLRSARQSRIFLDS